MPGPVAGACETDRTSTHAASRPKPYNFVCIPDAELHRLDSLGRSGAVGKPVDDAHGCYASTALSDRQLLGSRHERDAGRYTSCRPRYDFTARIYITGCLRGSRNVPRNVAWALQLQLRRWAKLEMGDGNGGAPCRSNRLTSPASRAAAGNANVQRAAGSHSKYRTAWRHTPWAAQHAGG
eukprot:362516-Chlamydomonas_euryale.AAC.3